MKATLHFLTGANDINDDAVWEQYQKDLESYNLSEILLKSVRLHMTDIWLVNQPFIISY